VQGRTVEGCISQFPWIDQKRHQNLVLTWLCRDDQKARSPKFEVGCYVIMEASVSDGVVGEMDGLYKMYEIE
jgi:hypothetical protein